MKKDYAIIFQRLEHNDNIFYIPIDVSEGIYLENKNTFTAHNVALKHIAYGEEYGYCFREKMTEFLNKNKYIPMKVARKLILKAFNEYIYNRVLDENNTPVITISSKENNTMEMIMDSDIVNYYIKYYPTAIVYENSIKENIKKEKISIDVNKLYSELKKEIIGQDNQIKELLTIIWKSFNNYQNTKTRSILINGEKSSPKREIFKVIEDNTDIPIINTSIVNKYKNNIKLNTTEDILRSLLIKYNYDTKKIENSIIVIDDIDTITITNENDARAFSEYQNSIINLMRGNTFTIEDDDKEYTIDTSNMLTILMGDFAKYEKDFPKINGFNGTNSKDTTKMSREDYIYEGLSEVLVLSLQNIIELDKPTSREYINNIYNDEESIFNISKRYFEELGIKLTIEEAAIEVISKMIDKKSYAEEQINEIIDRVLTPASFEIAINPNGYEELVITEETVKDNNNYKLIRRKN